MDNNIVQHYRGTTEAWATASYIPADGEIVVEVITQPDSSVIRKIKVGDGINTYSQLSYVDADTAAQLEVVVNRISNLENNAAECATDTELKTEIEALQGTILTVLSNTKGEIENAYTTAITDAVNTAKTELNGRADGLDTRLTEAENKIRGLQGDTAVAELSGRVDALENTTIDSRVQAAVDGLKEEIKGTTDGLANDIEGIQASLDDKADRTYVDDQVASLATGIDVQAELDTLRELLANNNSAAAAMLGKVLDTVEASLKTDVDSATTVLGYITNIYRELADLGRDNDFIINQMYAVMNTSKQLEDDLKAKLTAYDTDLTAICEQAISKMGELDAAVAQGDKDIKNAIALINDPQTGAIADLAAFKAGIETDHGTFKSEVRDGINALKTLVNSLMLLPDGSTTGDAALDALKVDYFGKTYATPVEHIHNIDQKVAELGRKKHVDGLVCEENKLYLVADGEQVGDSVLVVAGTGTGGGNMGGGGSGTQVRIGLDASSPQKVTVMQGDPDVTIAFTYTSVYFGTSDWSQTNTGTVEVYINGEHIEELDDDVYDYASAAYANHVNTVTIPMKYLTGGDNNIQITCKDAFGGKQILNCYIKLVVLAVELADKVQAASPISFMTAANMSELQVAIKPIGAVTKTLYVDIMDADGNRTSVENFYNIDIDPDDEDTRYVNITNYINKHGIYTFRAWLSAEVGGQLKNSDPITYRIIYAVKDTEYKTLLTTNFNNSGTIYVGTKLKIPYFAFNPQGSTTTVKFYLKYKLDKDDDEYLPYEPNDRNAGTDYENTGYIGEAEFNSGTIPDPLELVDYPEGYCLLTFSSTYTEMDGTSKTVSASTNFMSEALPAGSSLEAVESPLQLHLDAGADLTKTNDSPEDVRSTWTFKRAANQGGGEVQAKLTGFNWKTNGWLNDELGNRCLRLTGDARLSIPFNPYKYTNDNMTGLTIEFEFAIRSLSRRDITVLDCTYPAPSVQAGLVLRADRAVLRTESTLVECKYGENERVRVSVVIEPHNKQDNALMYIYLDGVLSGVKPFENTDKLYYNPDPAPSPEYAMVLGADGCNTDLYSIRVYNTALTANDIVCNYVADRSTIAERKALTYANSLYIDAKDNSTHNYDNDAFGHIDMCYDTVVSRSEIPVITFTLNGANLPEAKTDPALTNVDMCYIDPNIDETRNPIFNGTLKAFSVQGTSSATYPTKNWKLKLHDEVEGIPAQGMPPAKVLCLKVDYAESTGTHNTGVANFVETFYTETDIPPRALDENQQHIRSAVYGQPCLVFMKKNANSEPIFYAKGNINYDKGAEEIFGFTEDNFKKYGVECWEFCDNVSDYCNFFKPLAAYDTLPENDYKFWKSYFEPRYVPEGRAYGYNWEDIESTCQKIEAKEDVNPLQKATLLANLNNCIANFRKVQNWVASTALCTVSGSDKPDSPRQLKFHPDPTKEELEQLIAEGRLPDSIKPLGKTYTATYEDGSTEHFDYDTASYRKAKFKTEFENYFSLDWCLVYYVFTYVFLMADQRSKNMFLTYWRDEPGDNENAPGKWYPYFYDNDTIFGLNNQGELVYDYFDDDTRFKNGLTEADVIGEVTAEERMFGYERTFTTDTVYSGQYNALWYNFKTMFASKISEKYKKLRVTNVINEDDIYERFITNHSKKWSATVYNEDAYTKYLSSVVAGKVSDDLPKVKGSGEHHLKYFIKNRLDFCDSKWNAGNNAADDNSIILRLNASSSTDAIELEAYSHTVLNVNYGTVNATDDTTKVMSPDSAEPTKFYPPASASSISNLDTKIFPANQISAIRGLAPFKVGYVTIPSAPRLTELVLGSAANSYKNEALYALDLRGCPLLTKLDIRNCTGLGKATDTDKEGSSPNPVLNLVGCPLIETVYATGTSVTSIALPTGGHARTLQLPDTVTSLIINGHTNLRYKPNIHDAGIISEWPTSGDDVDGLRIADIYDGSVYTPAHITELKILDCPEVDSMALFNRYKDTISKLTLSGINWTCDDLTLLKDIADRINNGELGPVDEVDKVLSGVCKINSNVDGDELTYIINTFDNKTGLSIEPQGVTANLYFMPSRASDNYIDDNIGTLTLSIGEAGVTIDPTSDDYKEDYEAILANVPVKESDDYYTYRFAGWTTAADPEYEYFTDETDLNIAFAYIQRTRVLYPVYYREERKYKVQFKRTAAEDTMYETEVGYGQEAMFNPAIDIEVDIVHPDDEGIDDPAERQYTCVGWLLWEPKVEGLTLECITQDCIFIADFSEVNSTFYTLYANTYGGTPSGGIYEIVEGASGSCARLQNVALDEAIRRKNTALAIPAYVTADGMMPNGVGDSYPVECVFDKTQKDGQFANDVFITSLKLPSTLITIDDKAFCKKATNLKEVIFDVEDLTQAKLTNIPEEAFTDCTDLVTVQLPPSITEIGKSAFAGCTSLESIILPEKLRVIQDETFRGCTALKELELPASITGVANTAFYQNKNTHIKVNSGNTSFVDCDCVLLNKLPTDGDKYIILYAKKDAAADSIFNAETPQYAIQSIGFEAFESNESIKNIKIPDGVTALKSGCFQQSSVETAILPDSVTEIESYAFSYCTKLSSITLPEYVESYYPGFLKGTTNLSEITVLDSDAVAQTHFYVEDGVLFSSTNGNITLEKYPANKPDTKYTIPRDVKSIASGAFADAKNLEIVEFTSVPGIISYESSGSTSTVLFGVAFDAFGDLALPFGVDKISPDHEIEFIVPWTEGQHSFYYHKPANVTLPGDSARFWGAPIGSSITFISGEQIEREV